MSTTLGKQITEQIIAALENNRVSWRRPWRSPRNAGRPTSVSTGKPYNELLEGIHDRMPVILSPEDYELWLEPDFHGPGKLQEMLKPYPAEEMEAYPVSTVANNPRNEKEDCIKAVL